MEYRLGSRVISIVHMLWAVFQILGTFLVVFVEDYKYPAINDIPYTALLFTLLLVCVVDGFQIYGGWQLFKGTEKGVSAKDGLGRCRVWRTIAVVVIGFTIIQIVLVIIQGSISIIASSVFAVINVGLLVSALKFVQRYMNQLETAPIPKTNTSTGGIVGLV